MRTFTAKMWKNPVVVVDKISAVAAQKYLNDFLKKLQAE